MKKLLAWHSDLRDGARTGQPSARIMWLGVVSYHVLGHDTSVRQHYADHKKIYMLAITRPTQKNCPYPKTFFGLLEKDIFYFMFSDSVFSIPSVFPFKNAENVL